MKLTDTLNILPGTALKNKNSLQSAQYQSNKQNSILPALMQKKKTATQQTETHQTPDHGCKKIMGADCYSGFIFYMAAYFIHLTG